MTEPTAVPDVRFPIGRFAPPPAVDEVSRAGLVDDVAALPARFRTAVDGLSDAQLDTPYRDAGWTVRQLVHHLPDSHMNAFTRFKLALTEDEPTIKPYDEARWALLPDVASTPIASSLALLDRLHERWVILLRGMTAEEFDRRLVHPEHGPLPLWRLLALYAWHGRHHTAHVTALRERNGW